MEHGPMPGDGHAQGLELLKGDGFVDAGEAGPVRSVPDDEIRDVGCGEAPGAFENPMCLIGANAQLSSQNSASEIS